MLEVIVGRHPYAPSVDHRRIVGPELAEFDAEIHYTDAASPAAVLDASRTATVLLNPPYPTDAALLNDLPELSVIVTPTVGIDHIDLDAAAAHDVTVIHTPGHGAEEVSTHALALLLACVREIPIWNRSVRSGSWDRNAGRPLHRLAGATVGFVGFGRIAQRLAQKLRGFEPTVIAYNPGRSADEIADRRAEKVGFDSLLARSRIVTIHCPLTDDTRELFDAAAFEAMDPDSVLVNTARGEIIDETALHHALVSGQIAGAGLDVLADEPRTESPLFDLENVVLSPHIGGYSEESVEETYRRAIGYLVEYLRGARPNGVVR